MYDLPDHRNTLASVLFFLMEDVSIDLIKNRIIVLLLVLPLKQTNKKNFGIYFLHWIKRILPVFFTLIQRFSYYMGDLEVLNTAKRMESTFFEFHFT